MNNTLVLTSNDWWHIFKHQEHNSLNKINIHKFEYIVGPYFIQNSHWVATIISMETKKFIVIDPKGDSTVLSEKCMDSWVHYYKIHQ